MGEIERDIGEPVLGEILRLVYRHTGITMTEKKRMMLQGRLRPRLIELGLETYRDYLDYLVAHSDETQVFINLVTTNETLFFRTPHIWDYFGRHYLPDWSAGGAGRTLSIWSAAASTGEEAYSIAMLCREHQIQNPGFRFQIEASDISTEVLSVAERGRYEGRTLNDLRERFPTLLGRYLVPQGEAMEVRPELRTPIHFGVHSLFDPPKIRARFDIVFLRNVLIYFNVADQERVLKNVLTSIVPGGMLVLGESESLARFQMPLEFVKPLVYRLPKAA